MGDVFFFHEDTKMKLIEIAQSFHIDKIHQKHTADYTLKFLAVISKFTQNSEIYYFNI